MKQDPSIKTRLVETFDTLKEIADFILTDKQDYMTPDYSAAAPRAFQLKAESGEKIDGEASPSGMEAGHAATAGAPAAGAEGETSLVAHGELAEKQLDAQRNPRLQL